MSLVIKVEVVHINTVSLNFPTTYFSCFLSGLNKEVTAIQLSKGLAGLSAQQIANLVIAYEPVRTECRQ